MNARDIARALYAGEDIQIDENALISEGEDGSWVQAWVWVSNEDIENGH